MKLAALTTVGCVLATACGSGPASPSRVGVNVLPETLTTASYEFHYATGDSVDSAWQESYHQWAVAALDITVPRRISYNKYTSRAHMGSVTGVSTTNGYADADRFAIHTLWPRDNHEVVHLYSSLFGRPVALWSEGLAVAFQTDPVSGDLVPRWSRVPVHDLAQQFRQQGRLVPLDNLLATSDFRRFDDSVTYPEAGSFVRFVLDTYGLDTIKAVYRPGSPTDSADTVRAQFHATSGRHLADVERDWLAMLDGR